MIKVFENFTEREKSRLKAQELADRIVVLSGEVFKDPTGWKEFLINSIASWPKPDICQIEFKHNGNSSLFCGISLAQGQVVKTEYILIKLTWTWGGEELILKPFYDFLNHTFGENTSKFPSSFKTNEIDKIINELTLEEYELFIDTNKYNL